MTASPINPKKSPQSISSEWKDLEQQKSLEDKMREKAARDLFYQLKGRGYDVFDILKLLRENYGRKGVEVWRKLSGVKV